jgi:hypothetical protein
MEMFMMGISANSSTAETGVAVTDGKGEDGVVSDVVPWGVVAGIRPKSPTGSPDVQAAPTIRSATVTAAAFSRRRSRVVSGLIILPRSLPMAFAG